MFKIEAFFLLQTLDQYSNAVTYNVLHKIKTVYRVFYFARYNLKAYDYTTFNVLCKV